MFLNSKFYHSFLVESRRKITNFLLVFMNETMLSVRKGQTMAQKQDFLPCFKPSAKHPYPCFPSCFLHHFETVVKMLFSSFIKCRKMYIFAMGYPQIFLEFYGQM